MTGGDENNNLSMPYGDEYWSALLKRVRIRTFEMIWLRRAGLTYDEIGGKFGVCRERVRQILRKHEMATGDSGLTGRK